MSRSEEVFPKIAGFGPACMKNNFVETDVLLFNYSAKTNEMTIFGYARPFLRDLNSPSNTKGKDSCKLEPRTCDKFFLGSNVIHRIVFNSTERNNQCSDSQNIISANCNPDISPSVMLNHSNYKDHLPTPCNVDTRNYMPNINATNSQYPQHPYSQHVGNFQNNWYNQNDEAVTHEKTQKQILENYEIFQNTNYLKNALRQYSIRKMRHNLRKKLLMARKRRNNMTDNERADILNKIRRLEHAVHRINYINGDNVEKAS